MRQTRRCFSLLAATAFATGSGIPHAGCGERGPPPPAAPAGSLRVARRHPAPGSRDCRKCKGCSWAAAATVPRAPPGPGLRGADPPGPYPPLPSAPAAAAPRPRPHTGSGPRSGLRHFPAPGPQRAHPAPRRTNGKRPGPAKGPARPHRSKGPAVLLRPPAAGPGPCGPESAPRWY